MDQIRERCGKEACELTSSKRISDDIMPHILNLWVIVFLSLVPDKGRNDETTDVNRPIYKYWNPRWQT